ncbi:unnamed protein product [Tuber melanosporum]|uniref:(Perigord truffle) hypothetical protein n=1 Tax=Tuber melanosporum (strain Mel28) TaxID=656061 RepID=D5GDV7_TUBMM|nr:uncharacterized protein GSTUM_00006297001 [Tuber melanosporum]CAZ82700.1 unnamed protein product [Tuber melanosporum]
MLTAALIGHVYWLPNTSESRGTSVNGGKLNHPVLVLGAEREGKVQVLLITSFGNTTLSVRFPNPTDQLRRKYLPLKVSGAAPHPDNGILLSVIARGEPPLLTKQSYVNLEPFEVEVRLLDSRHGSTCSLPDDMLGLLMKKLRELRPTFSVHQERRVVASSSSPAKRQPPAPPRQTTPAIQHHIPPPPRQATPATRHQPPLAARPPPPLRSPVPTQQHPLLSPQRTYSSPYGTTAPWQDFGQDLERNAPRQSRYTRTVDHHDSGAELDCSVVWDILGYLGIAVAVFVSVRYLFS